MSFIPSAAAQNTAALAGSNQASLASPLTALQTSIAGGNLAPAALIDAILSSVGFQTKIIDTSGPSTSNTTSSTSFVNMPTGASGSFTAPIAKTYLFHVDLQGTFITVSSGDISYRFVVNGTPVTPTKAMTWTQNEVSSRKNISFRQALAMNAGSNTIQLQWNVSAGTATWDVGGSMTIHVSG